MKKTVIAAAIAAALVLGSASPAGAAPTKAPVSFSFTAPINLLEDCCFVGIGLEPTTVTLPRIGRATVSGSIEWCGSSPYSPCPERAGTTLSLSFATPSGATLTLGGHTPIDEQTLTWAVTGGTGRFAGASGSGSYTYDLVFTPTALLATVQVTGTLHA